MMNSKWTQLLFITSLQWAVWAAHSLHPQFDRFTLGSVNIICTNYAMGVECDLPTPLAMHATNGSMYHRNIISYDTDGRYALGFCEIVPGEFYLSIYLFFPSDNTAGPPIWLANRNNPVDENATFSFLTTGSLELRDSQGNVKWSTRTERKGVKSLVFLNEVGNLELLDGANKTVWSSLENPTNTLVKNQIIEYDEGFLRPLVSSSTSNGVSEGRYSMAMRAGGLVLYARADNSSGLQPYRTYSYYGETDLKYVLHTCRHPTFATFFPGSIQFAAVLKQDTTARAPASVVDPELCSKGDTFDGGRGIFDLRGFSNWTSGVNDTKALKIEHDGTLRIYSWKAQAKTANDPEVVNLFSDDDPCSLPNVCGPYGICNRGPGVSGYSCSCPLRHRSMPNSFWDQVTSGDPSEGCKLPGETSSCAQENSFSQSQFIELDSVEYFANEFATPKLTSADQCKSLCLRNCSCHASFYRGSLGQCFHSFHPLLSFRRANSSSIAFIKVRSLESEPTDTSLVVGVSVGLAGTLLALLISSAGYCIWRRRSNRRLRSNKEEDLFLDTLPGLPPRLQLRDLQIATKDFSHKLGEGGFGTVYKGVLPDGSEVAVKRLEGASQGIKEFRAEVATIGSIHHINLVKLCGFCVEGVHRLLVYEYMVNGSLDRLLISRPPDANEGKRQSEKCYLDWKMRMSIASDTARGLAYLHEDCREKIMHLDIKPQNILLDKQFHAKVSDFGLSKLVKRDRQDSELTQMRGTPGYLAPEWLHMTAVTEKADVFSFGMLLLEIVSGRKNVEPSLGEEKRFFPSWAFRKFKSRQLHELLDSRLDELVDQIELIRVFQIAFWCIQEDPLARPTMGSVLQMLGGLVEISEPPQIFQYSQNQEHIVSIADCNSLSSSSMSSDICSRLSHVHLCNAVDHAENGNTTFSFIHEDR